MEFRRVRLDQKEQIRRLSAFATAVNRDYYEPLLGHEQTEYHVAKFLGVASIVDQLKCGYTYYLCESEGDLIGFFAFFPRNDALYLSKLYVDKAHRGKGLGKETVAFLKRQAKELGLTAIELNVNRFNPTVAVYEHWGFIRMGEEKIDIGSGFVMDDYVYRLELA